MCVCAEVLMERKKKIPVEIVIEGVSKFCEFMSKSSMIILIKVGFYYPL